MKAGPLGYLKILKDFLKYLILFQNAFKQLIKNAYNTDFWVRILGKIRMEEIDQGDIKKKILWNSW